MTMPVEQTAIEIATEYAMANGYAIDDRTAVGLVLAGMAIGAAAEAPARKELVAAYLRQFPTHVAGAVMGWARRLSVAAGGGPVR
jgi:hypothetical protein